MAYSSNDHSFDWKGFYFAVKMVPILVIVGLGIHYGLLTGGSSENSSNTRPGVASIEAAQQKPATRVLLSSTTPQRIINSVTIADVVPLSGKFIAADLVHMKLYLYQDAEIVDEFSIYSKGRAGTPWETPSGYYAIQTKEKNHFSSIGKVYMPYSMQFYGNYFIHGMTYYPDGTPTSSTFSGGCIKLETEDAQKVFEFAEKGTEVFVYDAKQTSPLKPLSLDPFPMPSIDAGAYLVADIDTGDVYAEKAAGEVRPIASVTKLMTALVANEIISLDKKVSVPEGVLFNPPVPENETSKTFLVNDLFYPLLMQSSNGVANSLASYYGKGGFVRWMNTTAKALNMDRTTFADPSGISPGNLSSTEDLFRLARYLTNKKSFVLKITNTQTKTITADDGTVYRVQNVNSPADKEPFEGGKVGHTTAAQDTMLSILSFHMDGLDRKVAVIVLGSPDQRKDTEQLAHWITLSAKNVSSNAACVGCNSPKTYRQIQFLP